MNTKTLYIKNMVCNRCIKVVREELEKLGLKVENVILGEAVVSSLEDIDNNQIKNVLEQNGFELIDDKQAKIIEKIKVIVIELIQNQSEDKLTGINISDFISEKVDKSYQYISSLFSSHEGVTLETYIINQKIEKVKELLIYNELSLTEISYRLGYSSVQHLSSQFKKITGLTPSEFKNLREKTRKPLDKVI
ncbi:MAG: helix-turn-helix domain-containing protein [Ignavibacteriaceae bacterium]